MEQTVVLGGTVTLEDVVRVARQHAAVTFSPAYEERVKRCRAHVDQFSREGKAIYGLTTGLGDNWRKFIPEEDRVKDSAQPHFSPHLRGG